MMKEDKIDGFKVNYEGTEIELVMSANALRIIHEKDMVKSNVYASIVAALDFILDYKNRTEFAVIDQNIEVTVVAAIHSQGTNVFIDIIHIIDNTNVFLRKGLEIVRIGDKLN